MQPSIPFVSLFLVHTAHVHRMTVSMNYVIAGFVRPPLPTRPPCPPPSHFNMHQVTSDKHPNSVSSSNSTVYCFVLLTDLVIYNSNDDDFKKVNQTI